MARIETVRAVSGNDETVAGSFRDPAGFVFRRDGAILRHVAKSYGPVYDCLVASGLYQSLVRDGLLLPHDEVPAGPRDKNAHRILAPVEVPFISYPYEWCFSQLRDSALVTLDIQIRAIGFQMSLKDASAYNIQLSGGRPVLVDTLSFEEYEEGYPWVAYKQFCQHFLAPLALMALRDVSLGRLLEIHLDGIPLELAARLLPLRSRLRPGLAMHLFSHARLQSRHAGAEMTREDFRGRMSRKGLLTILNSLRSTVRGLSWDPQVSAWSDYYQGESYDEVGFASKKILVADYLRSAGPEEAWDLGANTGEFTRIAAGQGVRVVSIDSDPGAIEISYREVARSRGATVYPIVADVSNPSPAGGWANTERMSLLDRGPTDAVIALALVHHLAITNNVPLEKVAEFFASLGRSLIIEYIPRGDPKVQRLLALRNHSFPGYCRQGFEEAFAKYFSIDRADPIANSGRRLYLMTNLSHALRR